MSKRAVGPSPGEFEAYPMDFAFSEKTKEFERRLLAFMDEHIYPNEPRYYEQTERNRWQPTRIIEELKPKARARGERICDQRAKVVGFRRRRSALQDCHLHGEDGLDRCRVQTTIDDSGAYGFARRENNSIVERVRVRPRAARPCRDYL